MVMLAEPLARALQAARAAQAAAGFADSKTIYLSPAGAPLTQRAVSEVVAAPARALVLLAGRYEGVDERLLEREVDEELSIGDFVVSGGELPALVLIDAIVRQLPGALKDAESARQDSFADGLLDWPHYTRPERWPEDDAGSRVPEVLLSGHHAEIRRWRLKQALGRTWLRRPELLQARGMSDEEKRLLAEFRNEQRTIGGS
jgi:tRNA (guanine37-N1)-methyltransferase